MNDEDDELFAEARRTKKAPPPHRRLYDAIFIRLQDRLRSDVKMDKITAEVSSRGINYI